MQQIRSFMGGLGNRLFQYAYLYSQAKRGVIPDYYLQDEKYFKENREYLKNLLSLDIVPSDYISLHIRRGDYKGNPFYVDLTQTDYYDKAIAEFPNEKFLVFCADRQEGSDDNADMQWCRNKFKGDRFSFLISGSEVQDFNAMAGCKGHIMANSSFSWWASYISEGKTIAPKQWFTDGVQRTTLLDEWIKI